jgi:hypothetical protein
MIKAYVAFLMTKPGSIGRYESEVEFHTIMKLILRHFESLLTLARKDLVLAPSANIIARTVFEASVRVRWMFLPLDPYEREARWILHLRSAKLQAKKLSESEYMRESVAKAYNDRLAAYSQFDSDICKKLNKINYTVPDKSPNLRGMIKDLNEPYLYNYYVLLSAYSHSNFEAASLYKQGLGGAKKLGEFTSVIDWVVPFEVTWKSYFLAAREFLRLIEADVEGFEKAADVLGFERALNALTSS